MTNKLRTLINLRSGSLFLLGLLIGIFSNVFAAAIQDRLREFLPYLAALMLLALAGAYYSFSRQPPGIDLIMDTPEPVDEVDEIALARRGWVGFVPLLTMPSDREMEKLEEAEKEKALAQRRKLIDDLAFDQLDLEHSNFAPTVKAITSHKSKLEHCWLVATHGTSRSAGSEGYSRLLVEYLRQKHKITCTFHTCEDADEKNCLIAIADDAAVPAKTYRSIKAIFAEAQKLTPSHSEVIADLTTGSRSMIIGLLMACLVMGVDVEFVSTHYKESGSPRPVLLPTIFRFGSRKLRSD